MTIYAAGILAVTQNGKALFLKRGAGGDYPGYWCTPGGRLEDGEDAATAAIRETMEETGKKFKKDELFYLTRRIAPQGSALQGIAPTPAPNGAPELGLGEDVDFTTFVVRNIEEFTPKTNDEISGYAWAPVDSPPAPLHPGVQVAIQRLSMDELGIARAIAAGDLTSPQRYGNISLFALRISGTGIAYRAEKKDSKGKVLQESEVVYRRPENYLSPDFLTRCNGLPVIVYHPEDAILDGEQFQRRVVGAIMLPYIKGDEVWGIARIYDEATAHELATRQLSTSPGVVLGKANFEVTTNEGQKILIEDKPSLLDHLAICERGVWDKGGEPTGVQTTATGDEDMKINLKRLDGESDAAYQGRCDEAAKLFGQLANDSDGNKAPDIAAVIAEQFKGVNTLLTDISGRVGAIEKARNDAEEEKKEEKKADARKRADAFEFPPKKDGESDEDFKKRRDAEEKSCMDAEMEAGEAETVAADKAKKRRDSADEDDKKKADADKDKDGDAKHDSIIKANTELRAQLDALTAKLEPVLAKPPSGDDRKRLVTAQARADSVLTMTGSQARAPMLGETPDAYELAMVQSVQHLSKTWKGRDLGKVAIDSDNLKVAVDTVYDEALAAARRPTDIPSGELIMRTRTDGGHTFNDWHGESAAWMHRAAGPIRLQGVGHWKTPQNNRAAH